jgi:hypothetical protein
LSASLVVADVDATTIVVAHLPLLSRQLLLLPLLLLLQQQLLLMLLLLLMQLILLLLLLQLLLQLLRDQALVQMNPHHLTMSCGKSCSSSRSSCKP